VVPDEFRSFVARRGQLLRLVSLSDVAGSNRSRQTKHLAILNVTQSAFGNREYVAKFQSREAKEGGPMQRVQNAADQHALHVALEKAVLEQIKQPFFRTARNPVR